MSAAANDHSTAWGFASETEARVAARKAVHQIATTLAARVYAKGGKRRDDVALEFFCGGWKGMACALGEDHPTARALSLACFLVSARGYAEVRRILAEGAE